MRRLGLPLLLAFLALALLLMVGDALVGGDWPGWDEGWAVLAFPLGVPVATAIWLALSSPGRARATLVRATLGVTLAVWTWGGIVFVLWHALG